VFSSIEASVSATWQSAKRSIDANIGIIYYYSRAIIVTVVTAIKLNTSSAKEPIA